MWFKHLHLYRLHDTTPIALEALESALEAFAFRPVSPSEGKRLGWQRPAGRHGQQLAHEIQGHRLLSLLRQERLLPASVVREEVDERAAEREAAEGGPLPRRERQALKEQVVEEFLPRAFTRSQRIDIWWDTRRGLIGVNCASRARAEDALDLLRQSLGSLKVTPLAVRQLPSRSMTAWLEDIASRPEGLQLGDQVELKDANGDDGVWRARGIDLDGEEVQSVLASGRQASRLALDVEDQLSLILHDDLTLKSLRFADALLDEASQQEDDDDPTLRLETDFALMAQVLSGFIEQLIDWLGGEADPAAPTS
ncbi:recombination-associated protein RdgC [Chromohalobacter nigrandesensis]|uniref:recombination-associated protein RdgC n=1 Tax=Chromohalobacter nigrandesensis TaxID=119863 RepID=UPI001FF19552|nr:recombination-associated protein RdgC [Chromohalobacter nigrandesensis]MCK0745674.1 recombination-associated protein RdgC [Chromohalobacter nigrandesensis]